MPDAEILDAMTADNIKVGKLVHDFLTAQSLKILPQAPFGDAITDFVDKGDKHAVETFVTESLSVQVRDLLSREDDEEDLDPAIERFRTQQEKLFAKGLLKLSKKKGILKPKPTNWDSDCDGPWPDSAMAYEFVSADEEEATPAPAARRGKKAAAMLDDDDDAASVMSTTTKKPAAKKAPAKRAPAKPKAAAKPKAPAKAPARGRKQAAEPSDDEDDDVVMLDSPPPVKAQPKRAAAVTSQARTQTKLNFSQSQAKSQAIELSDDEISDEDAFEPVASSKASSSRRR